MSISLNDQYASLRSSALDLDRVSKAQGRRITKLAAGSEVADPTSAGVEAGSVLKLRNSGLRLRALETGMINAMSFLEAQGSVFQQMSVAVSRLSQLAVQMKDAVKSEEDVQNYFSEVSELLKELSSYRTAQFNGQDLMRYLYSQDALDRGLNDFVSSVNELSVALTEDGKQSATITLNDSSTFNTSLESLLGKISDSTAPDDDGFGSGETSATFLSESDWGQKGFDLLTNDLAQRIALNQSEQAALRLNLDRIRDRMLGTEAATSRVADADVAQELSALARTDMQFRGAIATRTQSNVLADSALVILSNQIFASPLIRESRLSSPFAG
jgi:flagellin-like hook-associated protein FlgL